MSISVRRDIAGRFGVPRDNFSLKADTRNFVSGSYGAFVRDEVAERNVRQLLEGAGVTWGVIAPVLGTAVVATILSGGTLSTVVLATAIPAVIAILSQKRIQKNLVKEMARNFGMRTQADRDMFDDYWHIIHEGRKFAADHKDTTIRSDLNEAYRMLARVAANRTQIRDNPARPSDPVTWKRIEEKGTESGAANNYVVFSDHHFTNLPGARGRLNYALRDNLDLYLEVLDYYADRSDWCLVENGDVEECVIFETTAADAQLRKDLRATMPVDFDSPDWEDFLSNRYEKRQEALGQVFAGFSLYYDKIKTRFIPRGRYVRLTGNHDTYSEGDFEVLLRDQIVGQLDGFPVHDVLRIWRNDAVTHVVLHGHQFDTVSIQHGLINFAPSCGEVFSECTAWTNEGPDRYWDAHETSEWVYGDGSFRNQLAREEPPEVPGNVVGVLAGLLSNSVGTNFDVRENTRQIVESMMKHEIGWEYYDHDDAFNALGLEVLTGDDAFKFRHLNEIDLTRLYLGEFATMDWQGDPSWPVPSVILGHTHEVRQGAVYGETGPREFYLNSGSAGRFHNLIWCVEITPSGDQIVSWSRVGNRIQRRVWTPDHMEVTAPSPGAPGTMRTLYGSSLRPSAPQFV